MAATLLLNTATWDIVVGIDGNIALASEPLNLAQDAASAIKVFLGEWWWDTTIGVPYYTEVFGLRPTLALLKQLFIDAALTVPGIAAAQCFISDFSSRAISGQIQVVASTGGAAAANFTVANPQGSG
jgi:hypothetical protein